MNLQPRFYWLAFSAVAGAPAITIAACGGHSTTTAECAAGTSPQHGICVLPDGSSADQSTRSEDSGTVPDASQDVASGSECPSARGPTMVRVPAADGGSYCIDSTEVTQSQYAHFLDAAGGTIGAQPSYCRWNTTYAPYFQDDAGPGFDPSTRGDYPVEGVNWCDAVAFCAWADGRLCSVRYYPALSGEWINACTSGGQYSYTYGDTNIPGACEDESRRLDSGTSIGATIPAGSLTTCQSPSPQYSGVFDLVGNVSEWVSACSSNEPDGSLPNDPTTPCQVLGYFIGAQCVEDPATLMNLRFPMNSAGHDLGFRCCAD
jgi:sulfatase modifying factor 1